MRDFMWNVCTVLLSVVIGMLVLSAFFATVIGLSYVVDKHSCAVYSETTGRETKYSFQVCYVKDETNNKWYTMNEFLARQGIIKTQ